MGIAASTDAGIGIFASGEADAFNMDSRWSFFSGFGNFLKKYGWHIASAGLMTGSQMGGGQAQAAASLKTYKKQYANGCSLLAQQLKIYNELADSLNIIATDNSITGAAQGFQNAYTAYEAVAQHYATANEYKEQKFTRNILIQIVISFVVFALFAFIVISRSQALRGKLNEITNFEKSSGYIK